MDPLRLHPMGHHKRNVAGWGRNAAAALLQRAGCCEVDGEALAAEEECRFPKRAVLTVALQRLQYTTVLRIRKGFQLRALIG